MSPAVLLVAMPGQAAAQSRGDSPTLDPGTLKWHAQQAKQKGLRKLTLANPLGFFASANSLDEVLAAYSVLVATPMAKAVEIDSGRQILTIYKLQVLRRLADHPPAPDTLQRQIPAAFGRLQDNEIVVTQYGGTAVVDGVEITQNDPKFPLMVEGRRYLLFLMFDSTGKVGELQLGPEAILEVDQAGLFKPMTERHSPLLDDLATATYNSLAQLEHVVGVRVGR